MRVQKAETLLSWEKFFELLSKKKTTQHATVPIWENSHVPETHCSCMRLKATKKKKLKASDLEKQSKFKNEQTFKKRKAKIEKTTVWNFSRGKNVIWSCKTKKRETKRVMIVKKIRRSLWTNANAAQAQVSKRQTLKSPPNSSSTSSKKTLTAFETSLVHWEC